MVGIVFLNIYILSCFNFLYDLGELKFSKILLQ